MAVAVKTTPETAPQQPLYGLAVGSLVGTLYVLACLVIVYALPNFWRWLITPGVAGVAGEFVDAALRLLVVLGVVAAAVLLGRLLIGSEPPRGLRAGVFVGVLGVLVIGLLTRAVGVWLERGLGESGAFLGMVLTAAVGLALLVAGSMAFFRAGFDRWLLQVEDQGWFSTTAYKRAQGQRVRRGTILGILILAASGIYTLLAHKTLETGSANWEVLLPFTAGKTLILLPDVRFTVPLLCAAAALWLGYRIVNYPAFADFLIATEAELNKVSWTTRKRLIQDTVVVLTTMLLITAFLFVMDFIWIKTLSWSWINILQTEKIDTRELDAQIERLAREKEAAVAQGETEKVLRLDNEIDNLHRQRESIIRGRRGGPQDW